MCESQVDVLCAYELYTYMVLLVIYVYTHSIL